jgi:hypothetical protein
VGATWTLKQQPFKDFQLFLLHFSRLIQHEVIIFWFHFDFNFENFKFRSASPDNEALIALCPVLKDVFAEQKRYFRVRSLKEMCMIVAIKKVRTIYFLNRKAYDVLRKFFNWALNFY